jgi:hypothetical protein
MLRKERSDGLVQGVDIFSRTARLYQQPQELLPVPVADRPHLGYRLSPSTFTLREHSCLGVESGV